MVVNLYYVKGSVVNVIIGTGYEESRNELYDKKYYEYLDLSYSSEWRKSIARGLYLNNNYLIFYY
jgi:hypothetical protein